MFERQEERLSLSPCGDEVWRGEVPSLGKEGRVVVKRNFSKQDDTISVMLGIILEPNAKKLKKTDINLTLVKGIPESPRAIDLFSYLSRYIRE